MPIPPAQMTTEPDTARYLREIHKFPLLNVEEEYALARRWCAHQERHAAHKLATSHLRLVAKIAMGYRGYGLPVAELISEGNVGLMKAIKRFDPDRGSRLATYAIPWIRANIQEYILHNCLLVKTGTTAAQKKLFFNLGRLTARMQVNESRDLQPEQVTQIATLLDVPEKDVISMHRRLMAPDLSLDASVHPDSEHTWQDRLVDDTTNQEMDIAEREELSQRKEFLPTALEALGKRERQILSERRLKDRPPTLDELADRYGVSRERIRQIETRAFTKLQRAVLGQIAAQRAAMVEGHRTIVLQDR